MIPVFDPITGNIAVSKKSFPKLQIPDTIASNRWTRPDGWIAMPAMTGADEKFVALFRVDDHDANFVAFIVSGDFTVNWGDGVTENFSAGATATHTYSYADADITDTSGTLGYKQALITVTPQAGQQLTALNLNVRHPSAYSGRVVTNYLDVAVSLPNCGASGFSFGTSGTQYAYPAYLEKATIYNLGAQTSLAYAFYNFPSLRDVSVAGINSVTSLNSAFQTCYKLEAASISAAANVVSATSLFASCYSLQDADIGVFSSSGWDATSLFDSCRGLIAAPNIDTSKVTAAANMFLSCANLRSVPLYDFSMCATLSGFFNACNSLEEIPLFSNTSGVTTFLNFAANCVALKKVAKLDTSGATSLASMFLGCSSLPRVPDLTTNSAQNFTSMFQNCYSLVQPPTLSFLSATDISFMFKSCYSLAGAITVDFTTNSNCAATNVFEFCYGITALSVTAAPKITSLASFAKDCYRLRSASIPTLPVCTSLSAAFSNCSAVESVSIGTAPALANISSMFSACAALKSPPIFDTSVATNALSMFSTASAVETVPAYNFNSMTTMITSLPNGVSKFLPTNIGISLNLSNLRLSAAALGTVFGNLKSNVTAQTLTLTGNFGVDAAVTKTSLSTTAKSTTISMADTSALTVGMLATNATVWAGVSVTSDVSADTLTLAGHNIPNGTIVSFTALGTTTGITTKTPYYVVNAATNTFQIALTPGGSAIDLTGSNATMTVQWWSKIASINPNVSITLDAPAPTTQVAQSISFRLLDATLALAKGWTVTY